MLGLTLRALMRHKVIVGLMAIEIAFCFALMANGGALLAAQLGPMNHLRLPPEPASLYVVDPGDGDFGLPGEKMASLAKADLAGLASIPGVSAVGQINGVPLGGQAETVPLSTIPKETPDLEVAVYRATLGALDALNLTYLGGRSLGRDDATQFTNTTSPSVGPSVLVTQALGAKLFAGGNPVGRAVFFGDAGQYKATIVGVVGDISRPIIDASSDSTLAVITVAEPFAGGVYVARSTENDPAELKLSVGKVLAANLSARKQIDTRSLEEVSREYFKSERALAQLLLSLLIAVFLVCTIGVSGIASYWIRQRHRAVGIRRALGASKRQILTEFCIEIAAISICGVIVGVAVYLASSAALMWKFGLPVLGPLSLAALAGCTVLVCLASVARSIREAGSLSPIDALRR